MHIKFILLAELAVVAFLLILWRRLFPKVKLKAQVLVVLVGILPLVSILRLGTYQSGDLSLHVYRAMDFYSVLSEGKLVPLWAGQLNGRFGYPLFEFIYPLPYYLISLFHWWGISFIASVKLLLATGFLLSGLTMYHWVKHETGNDKAGLAAAMFYLFAPYHLVNLHFRVAIGEVLALAFLPLVFLTTCRVIKNSSLTNIVAGGLALAGLLLSHQAVFALAIPVLVVYFILKLTLIKKNRLRYRRLVSGVGLGLMGLGLSAFHWLPAVAESKFTHQVFMNKVEYLSLSDLLYSPWRGGFLFQGSGGELSFLIGYSQLVLMGLALMLVFRKKFSAASWPLVLLCLITIAALVLMMLPASWPVWQLFPLLLRFQFSYRILAVVILVISFLAGMVFKTIKWNWLTVGWCAATVLYTGLNWGNRSSLPQVNDAVLRRELPTSTIRGEGFSAATPIFVSNSQLLKLNQTDTGGQMEIITGQGSLENISHSSTDHEYKIKAKTDLWVSANVLYYPGWQVIDNGQSVKIDFQKPDYEGVITFKLSPGSHQVKVLLTDTPMRRTAKLVSLLTMALIFGMFGARRLLPKFEILAS